MYELLKLVKKTILSDPIVLLSIYSEWRIALKVVEYLQLKSVSPALLMAVMIKLLLI